MLRQDRKRRPKDKGRRYGYKDESPADTAKFTLAVLGPPVLIGVGGYYLYKRFFKK